VLLLCILHSAFSLRGPVKLNVDIFSQRMNEHAIVAGTTGQGLDQILDEVVDSVATPVGTSSDGGNVGNGLNKALMNVVSNIANAQ
jgi:trans-2-enoyl-CoA reductase